MSSSAQKEIPMSEAERALMLRVLDGNPDLAPVVYHLWHYRRADEMFRWLIAHDFTGVKLAAWLRDVHGMSLLNLAKFLISKLERERGVRNVLIGRDFIA